MRIGVLRVQPAFSDVPLLQGIARDLKASLAAREQVGQLRGAPVLVLMTQAAWGPDNFATLPLCRLGRYDNEDLLLLVLLLT